MTCAGGAAKLVVVVRIFETHPPSHVLISLATLCLFLIGGIAVVAPFLVGVALAALGHALDLYGVRDRR